MPANSFKLSLQIDGFTEQVRTMLPGNVEVDLTGVDVELAREAGAQLVGLAREWPEAMAQLKVITGRPLGPGCYAVIIPSEGRLLLNTDYWQDRQILEKLHGNDVRMAYQPRGTGNAAGVITEEVGHLLKHWIDSSGHGAELDALIDAQPLPAEVCSLHPAELRPAARRRQETFGRWIRVRELRPDAKHEWIDQVSDAVSGAAQRIRNQ